MNDLPGQLMGGGQKQEFEDFTRRYEQGSPWDGFDDDEARDKYRRVAPNLPPDLYEESAQETFSRMTPEQRYELGRQLQQSARQEGLSFDADDDDALRDPRTLARATSRIQQERPDFLEQMLGGGSTRGAGGGMGGMLGGGLGRAALGGIAAIAVKKMMGGR
jgi:hypothetical protein